MSNYRCRDAMAFEDLRGHGAELGSLPLDVRVRLVRRRPRDVVRERKIAASHLDFVSDLLAHGNGAHEVFDGARLVLRAPGAGAGDFAEGAQGNGQVRLAAHLPE